MDEQSEFCDSSIAAWRVPRWALLVLMLVITWLLCGPVASFHHQYLFGIFGYLLLNGEDPAGAKLMWRGYEVIIHWPAMAASVLAWLLAAAATVKFWRR